jgi:proteasome lid subunit RPN8/RPN11
MFKIISETKQYQPLQGNLPEYMDNIIDDTQSKYVNDPDINHLLFIENNAWKSHICEHIGWGRKSTQNINEQGGILLGQTFYDEDQNKYFGYVKNAVPAIGAEGSPAYLNMNHRTWADMLNRLDEWNDFHNEEPLQVIGWYHTHPNELSVFMSGTDRNTQRLFFPKDWQFAIVINPHKQYWKAFYGLNAKECPGYILKNKTLDKNEEY